MDQGCLPKFDGVGSVQENRVRLRHGDGEIVDHAVRRRRQQRAGAQIAILLAFDEAHQTGLLLNRRALNAARGGSVAVPAGADSA
ncbi:hypothetical protein [Tahibacter harae]|uniref:Uncharacterized protein n=1 Tax=Tahibacter harae TaxID=2963937 RepID=A0ABT1QPH2_9GAMM|nr:hypothetical protein [Tahibacter harae]MCQ4164176.1 hypothetical protein [Tahibacter harae]